MGEQLRRVHADAVVKPVVVQQRFYSKTRFEREMRAWCATSGVHFQSFWMLTANSKKGRAGRDAISSRTVCKLSTKYNVTPEVLFFRFVMGLGIVPLTGTSSYEHMREDLGARRVQISLEDAEEIDAVLSRCEFEAS